MNGFGNDTCDTAVRSAMQQNEPLSDMYGRYRSELIGFVRRKFGKGPPEPEDVAQQAFVNFASLRSAGTIAHPRAFLFRIAHNIVLNSRKHDQIGRRFLESNPPPNERCEARDELDPEAVLLSREQCGLLEIAIRGMPPMRQEFLLLNRLEEFSYAEIARRMGRSESVVRKQVALAIRECGAAMLAAEQPLRSSEQSLISRDRGAESTRSIVYDYTSSNVGWTPAPAPKHSINETQVEHR